MGKKRKKKVSSSGKPFVSVCTPTYNRCKFIPYIIKCFQAQTYPKELMEWIIVDDGTDPIGDLVKDIAFVKYVYCPERMSLGKKRNFMHEQCTFKNDDDIMLITNKGQMIRCAVSDIRITGRNTQGVRIFKVEKDEKVVSSVCLTDSVAD